VSRIFLSHSSANSAEAIAIRDWMIAQGWNEVFLDLDPERGLKAGERWQEALKRAAERCELVVFLVSPVWAASKWCLAEFLLAKSLNKRIFAVIVEPTPYSELPTEMTAEWQITDLTTGARDHHVMVTLPGGQTTDVAFGKEGLDRLRVGLAQSGLDPKYFAWPPENDPNRLPYRGLLPLEADDAGIFFGREAPVVDALDRLRGLREAPPPRLLVILAASGAGKSSLLRAGLLPRLARDDRKFLPLPIIRPGRVVISGEMGLLRALEEACRRAKLSVARADLRTAIDGGSSKLRALLSMLAQEATPAADDNNALPKAPTLVISIDQGEELFLAEGQQEAQPFLALLRDLVTSDEPAVIVVLTIRSDNYERLQLAKELEGVRQRTLSLPPMPNGSYAEVIKGPARRLEGTSRAFSIEDALVDALLADIQAGSAKDALPLLAFTLERLYGEYGATGQLKLEQYERLGRIEGSIEAAIERALEALDADPTVPKERAVRLTLLRRALIPWLANIDLDTGQPRRRVARLSEIPAEAAQLIRHLTELRLLATDVARDSREVTVELAHEAILRQWGLLKGWLAEDFGDLATLEGVKRAARDWADNKRNQEWIAHAGGRLEEAERVAAREDFARHVEPAERAYLAACRAAAEAARKDREAQLTARERAQRRARWATIGVFIIALATLAGALYQTRETDRRETLVLTSAADRAIADQRYDAAMRIAVRGLPPPGTLPLALGWSTPEVTGLEAKLAGAAQLSRLLRVIKGHTAAINSVAFSADGARIVTGSADGTARVWNVATGEVLCELKHASGVDDVAFSADGARILTTSFDGAAQVWDAASGRRLRELKRPAQTRYSFGRRSLIADGFHFVTTFAGTIQVWDADSGKVVTEFKGQAFRAKSAAISTDNTRIVIADGQVARVWDTVSGNMLLELRGHEGMVYSAAFAVDGTRIVTASEDRTARVWNAVSGEMLRELKGHDAAVHSAAFSADGARIITGSNDQSARVWDAASGEMIRELWGHGDGITRATFSADGHVVTASSDQTARLWDLSGGEQVLHHDGDVMTAAFDAGGGRIVTASQDRTARLWDAASGKMVRELRHDDMVSQAAFSPDGALVLTLSGNIVHLWDAASGEPRGDLRDGGGVFGATFIADGASTHIVMVSDRRAGIWDAASAKLLRELKDHGSGYGTPAVSADGRRIATRSGDRARIWDAETGTLLREIISSGDSVWSTALSPNGTRLVTASLHGFARIWDSSTGELLRELKGHAGGVISAAFSTDGTRIVTASDDRTARVWDAASGEMLRELHGHGRALSTAAFNADSGRIVTAARDGTARVWDVSWGITLRGESLVRAVCAEKLAGAQTFTSRDATDPILVSLAGTNPCERRGPLATAYWTDVGRSILAWPEALGQKRRGD
jgi:WD40 repeat protein